MTNPLAGLVPDRQDDASRRRPSVPSNLAPSFAVVHATNPLRLSVDGEVLEGTPLSIVGGLAPGDLVLVQFVSTQLVVMGRVESEPGDLAKRRNNPPWRTPALYNGWSHYSSFRTLRYRRVGDEVQFRGTIRDGTAIGSGTALFFVDNDCLPQEGTPLLTGRNGTATGSNQDLRVTPGDGMVYGATATIPAWISFEGVRYFI